MEQVLLRTLMNKDFYDSNRGERCPETLFSTEGRKIKRTIDEMVDQYNRDLTPEEVRSYFVSANPSMTTAQLHQFDSMFHAIKNEQPMGSDVANDVLSKLFRKHVGDELVNVAVDLTNGDITSLQPLKDLLDKYNEDFTPTTKVEWEDISFETIMSMMEEDSKWKFNLPTLSQVVPGVNAGQLIEVGARPNTGKTSFHASMIAGPGGFVEQGAKCMVLCNEEAYNRVINRYLTCISNMTEMEIKRNPVEGKRRYQPIMEKLLVKDSTGKNMDWVEGVCKTYKPDILVLDMGDKFAKTYGFSRQDEALKANVIQARQIGKEYGCAIFYMSQLSAEAEGKTVLNQSMMEGSKTGKAAEADLMILVARNPDVGSNTNTSQEDPQRHLNIVKNKLTGWHGRLICTLDHEKARYKV
tara:strand:+ start:932 stop:2164 length:1233 start_codon:yes stop_codon:yes gene_type:complete